MVNALNADKPYDQFLLKHIAGDELVDRRNAASYTPEITEKLVATGFLRTVEIPVPYNGNVVQRKTIDGGITRETVQEARKIMPRGPSHLEAHTALINNVTIKEIEKWGRDEMGGDFAQDVVKNGWAEADFMGMTWIITIKRSLVPDGTDVCSRLLVMLTTRYSVTVYAASKVIDYWS